MTQSFNELYRSVKNCITNTCAAKEKALKKTVVQNEVNYD